LQLRDEGSGISPEHLARLTDPFFTTKRDSGGTGLGLSVSAGIVKEHGGTMTFDSTPGKGTVVTLTLPAYNKETNS
jgi:polar amino acid transport system substrate-binding protein